MKSKSKFTVVGMYKDNHQVYVTSLVAKDVAAAVVGAKGELLQECSRCGGEGGEPGAPQKPGEKALCSGCDGSGKETQIAVLSVFKGEHKDLYGEDELYEE